MKLTKQWLISSVERVVATAVVAGATYAIAQPAGLLTMPTVWHGAAVAAIGAALTALKTVAANALTGTASLVRDIERKS